MSGDDKPWTNLGFEEAQTRFRKPVTERPRLDGGMGRPLAVLPELRRGEDQPVSRQPAGRRLRVPRLPRRVRAEGAESRFGAKVLDGAYGAKMQRLAADNNPNLMLMNYDQGAA